MKNLKIQIPNMQSSHCQMRVNNALGTIEGIVINHIQPGIADISLEDANLQSEVVNVIEKAGYYVSGIEAQQTAADADGKTFTFKTNIHCQGCASQLASAFEAVEGICHWDLDIHNEDHILSVHSDGITREEIIRTVHNAGYNIEIIND